MRRGASRKWVKRRLREVREEGKKTRRESEEEGKRKELEEREKKLHGRQKRRSRGWRRYVDSCRKRGAG